MIPHKGAQALRRQLAAMPKRSKPKASLSACDGGAKREHQ